MAINIPPRLRDENFGTCLVKRYFATDTAGRAYYSGAHFEQIGGGGDRPEVADEFTAEDLLAVTMLSVRIEGYHALEILHHQAATLVSRTRLTPGSGGRMSRRFHCLDVRGDAANYRPTAQDLMNDAADLLYSLI